MWLMIRLVEYCDDLCWWFFLVEKSFIILVNNKTIQCHLSIPRTFWNSLPKSGYYKLTENNIVISYMPAPEPSKKAVLSTFGKDNSTETLTKTSVLSAEGNEEVDVFAED